LIPADRSWLNPSSCKSCAAVAGRHQHFFLDGIARQTNFYDLGYRLDPNQWGRGIATEASIAILNYYKNYNKICGIASVENIASNKVLIKSGLVFVNKFIDPINGKFDNWYEFN
jgi:RimJ/RimL family protein N-acetyltransferase